MEYWAPEDYLFTLSTTVNYLTIPLGKGDERGWNQVEERTMGKGSRHAPAGGTDAAQTFKP